MTILDENDLEDKRWKKDRRIIWKNARIVVNTWQHNKLKLMSVMFVSRGITQIPIMYLSEIKEENGDVMFLVGGMMVFFIGYIKQNTQWNPSDESLQVENMT